MSDDNIQAIGRSEQLTIRERIEKSNIQPLKDMVKEIDTLQHSEQQEWTPKYVHDMIVSGDFNGLRIAHNAALAAERQLRDEARAQREWLIKECGRIGVTVNVRIGAPITEAYELVNAERQQLQDLRIRYDSIREKFYKTEDQLLSAQAAIGRAKPLCVMGKNQDALFILERADMNASLLEHDAEVRKPLVKALTEIKDKGGERTVSQLRAIAADALAKVKHDFDSTRKEKR